MQLPLILLLAPWCICHAAWAKSAATNAQQQQQHAKTETKAETDINNNVTDAATPVPRLIPKLVSSSEATLLTMPTSLFPAPAPMPPKSSERQEHDVEIMEADVELAPPPTPPQTPRAHHIKAAKSSTAATTSKSLAAAGGGDHLPKKRYKVLAVHTNCTRDLFTMRIDLNRAFRGIIYAKDFPLECRARGGNAQQQNVTLRLPTSGCGVRAEPRADGVMELSVRVMLQIEQKLRQSTDILRTVRCKLPPTAMGMFVGPIGGGGKNGNNKSTKQWMKGVGGGKKGKKVIQKYRNGRMRTLSASSSENFTATNDNEDFTESTSQTHVPHDELETNKDEQQTVSKKASVAEEDGDVQETQANAKIVHTKTHNNLTADNAAGGEGSDHAETSDTLNANDESDSDNATSATMVTNTGANGGAGATPRVRIWLELGGLHGSGAVEVGQATTLTVRAIVPGAMGVRVVDCAALDGLGESKQQLLDERGCTIDEQVMPSLNKHLKPLDDGWSKQQPDDLMEKTFTATFPAFKFPDRERLHVSCGVQLCKGKCPSVNCRSTESLQLSSDKHLARIEVFNSLAVTAPQIEVDRLRYDRRYNMSAEEYPPNIRRIYSDGTLCLSVSKLAIAFCVLGLIFLIAVIVAIYSLIRARRRCTASSCTALTPPSSGSGNLQRGELCTSMFSSSSESAQSARFGSKLLMPYYPNTLPYGRVY